MTVRGPNSKTPKTPAKPSKLAKPATQPAPSAAAKPVAAAKPNLARNTLAEDGKGKSAFSGHTATVDVARGATANTAAAGGKRVADAVMQCIGSYDRTFLLDTDGLKAHVQQVATQFIAAAGTAGQKGSVYDQLKTRFPGAQISLAGTASLNAQDQLVYLVRGKDQVVHKFVEQSGKPVENPKASDQIFMAADLSKPSAHMAVRVPEVKFLVDPTLPPSYGVGRQIGVVLTQDLATLKRNATDSVSSEMSHVYKETLPGTQKGEDGSPLGVVYSDQREMKGTIVKYDGNQTYDVKLTLPDGTSKIVQQTESQIRSENDPMVYNLHGSTFDDVTIDVDSDPKLAAFLEQAKAVAAKDIPAKGTPEEIAKGQKQALVDLTVLCNKTMSYPDEEPNTTDEGSKKAMALMNSHSNWDPMKLGDLIDAGRGVCRHQAILMQLACQTAGISSRTVAATANDRQGNFRGYHAFLETTLDNGEQFLTDPTWFDAGPSNVKGYDFAPVVNGQKETGTPLWDTLYFNVLRQVLPSWQDNASNEDHSSVTFNESNDPVVGGGKVDGGTSDGGAPGTTAPDASAAIHTIVGDLHSVRVYRNGDIARGDLYMRTGSADDALKAAKEYAPAIADGKDTSKAAWLKLAGALSAAGKTSDAALANQIAAAR